MGDEGDYTFPGIQVEGSIRKAYETAIKDLRKAVTPEGGLEIVARVFDTLKGSRPDSERGIEWAQDIIEAYRNLGKAIADFQQKYEPRGTSSKYEKLLSDFDGETSADRLNNALTFFEEIEEMINKYGIVDKKDLKERLESFRDMNVILNKYNISDNEDLRKKLKELDELNDRLKEAQELETVNKRSQNLENYFS